MHGRWIGVTISITAALVACPGCRPDDRPATPNDTPAPIDASRAVPTPEPIQRVETADLERWLDEFEDEPDRWLRIERIDEDADGGWITGGIAAGNRIQLETHDVEQFVLDLSAIPIDWDKRVVLRIDGSTSELTRKHHPTVRLRRTPSGGWTTVKD